MPTRRDIRAMTRGAQARPGGALILGGLLLLMVPEGRPGVLRLGTQGRPQARNPRAPHESGRKRREGPNIMSAPAKSEQDRVFIFDTTLRDGEQCPGATMTHEEKLEVAELLDQMGVDIIEAGFPIASEGDFAAVQEIARRTKNAVVCGLSRAAFKDIDRCAEAIKPAKRSRIHTFISTSPVHMKYKLQKEPHEVYELVVAQVTRARGYTDDVEWSCEDGTRTEHDFLCRCVEAAINAGATTINIPDTVGYTVPEE